MTRPIVVRIEPEIAKPFVLAFCRRWRLPVDNIDAINNVWWFGYVDKGVIRAIMGIQYIDEESVHVWGWFGDGSNSISEKKALARLTEIVGKIPFAVSGTILVDNSKALRHARKLGWTFQRFMPSDEEGLRWKWGRAPLQGVRDMVAS